MYLRSIIALALAGFQITTINALDKKASFEQENRINYTHPVRPQCLRCSQQFSSFRELFAHYFEHKKTDTSKRQ